VNLFVQVRVEVVLITDSEYPKDNYHIIAFSPKVLLPIFAVLGLGWRQFVLLDIVMSILKQ